MKAGWTGFSNKQTRFVDSNQNIVPNFEIEQLNRRNRIRLLQIVIIVFFAIVGLRLVQVQIIQSQKFREIALKQYQAKVILPAARGLLYDRYGNIIASNSTLVSFAADPQVASEDADAIAKIFSRLFGKPKSHYIHELESDSRFVWLERLVDSKYLKEINPNKLNGIVVRYEPKRLYFNDHLAGQLIGCTNVDNVGVSGVEQQFEPELRGADGYVIFQRDGRRMARPSVDYPRVEPRDGNNIYLTIDLQLQAIAEKELKKGVELNKAERGLVIVLQPKTGELLAIAQYPGVDPNNFGKSDLQDQRLRAVTDLYEPGSVFKIVTASAALEHGIVKSQNIFFAENGSYTIWVTPTKPRKITDTHKYGYVTFQEAMEVSSNIVMAKVSDLIGGERFYKMARDFGFGIATNIEYPGEPKGVLKRPVEWSATTLNTLAYGYEVGVTPLQIASAYAAVANDGCLMKPVLFKKETDSHRNIIKEIQPQQIRRVISTSTAQTMKQLFEGVVERGTGTPAKIAGVRIAGKTGTSKKLIEGKYGTSGYIASFVGFFPTDDPQIVCLVMMDNPRGGSYYGGTVSAPVFRAIAEQIMTTTAVMSRAKSVVAASQEVTPLPENENKADVATQNAVPDVKGYSIRKAIEILKAKKLQPTVSGSGVVTGQTPGAGQPVKNGMIIKLVCQPKISAALDFK